MRILISADMEGITGVTTWDQVTPGHAEYVRFRKLMTEDVNAAVRGAFEAGAEAVLVADGHWNGSNILVEELDPRARLNSGAPSPSSMMQGIEEKIDGVFFIGYHARQGSASAILDHTWSSTCVHNVWINGRLAGEYTLNAAVAGQFAIPVILATGDEAACAQIAELVEGIDTVVVKRGSGRQAAEVLPPTVTQEMIQHAARLAVQKLVRKGAPRPLSVKGPIKIEVELQSSDMADRAALLPGAARDGLKVSFTASNMAEAYSSFRALVLLAYPR